MLYPLNPADYAALATLTGSFAEDGVRGKIQFGPAWWYNDHALGIRKHLDSLASYGLLSTFIGMTTDSRSLLSMIRHEYFRRVLCDWLGDQSAQPARCPTMTTPRPAGARRCLRQRTKAGCFRQEPHEPMHHE